MLRCMPTVGFQVNKYWMGLIQRYSEQNVSSHSFTTFASSRTRFTRLSINLFIPYKSSNQLSLLRISRLTMTTWYCLRVIFCPFVIRKGTKIYNQNHYLEQLVCCISPRDGYCADSVDFKHLGKLSTQQLQWAYYNRDAMLYIKQQDSVTQRLARSSWCYSNNILTHQHSTNYEDLPETWLKTK